MEEGLVIYGVFRVYGNGTIKFLVAAKTKQSAMKYCEENGLAFVGDTKMDPLYTTRATALLHAGKSIVIEKIALV
jgi:predicted transcriptional regulator